MKMTRFEARYALGEKTTPPDHLARTATKNIIAQNIHVATHFAIDQIGESMLSDDNAAFYVLKVMSVTDVGSVDVAVDVAGPTDGDEKERP